MKHWQKSVYAEYGPWVGGLIDNRVQTGFYESPQRIFTVEMKVAPKTTPLGFMAHPKVIRKSLFRYPWRKMTLAFHWKGYIEICERLWGNSVFRASKDLPTWRFNIWAEKFWAPHLAEPYSARDDGWWDKRECIPDRWVEYGQEIDQGVFHQNNLRARNIEGILGMKISFYFPIL